MEEVKEGFEFDEDFSYIFKSDFTDQVFILQKISSRLDEDFFGFVPSGNCKVSPLYITGMAKWSIEAARKWRRRIYKVKRFNILL